MVRVGVGRSTGLTWVDLGGELSSRMACCLQIGPSRQVLDAIAPTGEITYRGVHGVKKLIRFNVLRVTLKV